MVPKGKSVFIWKISNCEGGDISAISKKAQAAHLSSVCVKVSDGISPKHDGDTLRRLSAALGNRGIDTWVWGYQYGPGDDRRRYDLAHARLEGVTIAQRAIGINAKCIVLDPEIEFEETLGYKHIISPDEDPSAAAPYAKALCLGVREVWKGPLGYCPFWKPSVHGSYPWHTFSALTNFCSPQTYWGDWANPLSQLEISLKQLKPYGLPIYPAPAISGKESGWSGTKVRNWCKNASAKGLTGGIAWCWDEATTETWKAWAEWKP